MALAVADVISGDQFVNVLVDQPHIHVDETGALHSALVYTWARLQGEVRLCLQHMTKRLQVRFATQTYQCPFRCSWHNMAFNFIE